MTCTCFYYVWCSVFLTQLNQRIPEPAEQILYWGNKARSKAAGSGLYGSVVGLENPVNLFPEGRLVPGYSTGVSP